MIIHGWFSAERMLIPEGYWTSTLGYLSVSWKGPISIFPEAHFRMVFLGPDGYSRKICSPCPVEIDTSFPRVLAEDHDNICHQLKLVSHKEPTLKKPSLLRVVGKACPIGPSDESSLSSLRGVTNP